MADDHKQNIQTPRPQEKSGGPRKSESDQGNLLNFAQPAKRPDAEKKSSWELNLSSDAKPGAQPRKQPVKKQPAQGPQAKGQMKAHKQPVKQAPQAQAGFPQWLPKESAKPALKASKPRLNEQQPLKASRPGQPLKSNRPAQALGSSGNSSDDAQVMAKPAKRPHAEPKGLNAGERYATRRMPGQPKNDLSKALTKLQRERKSGKKKTRLEGWQQEQLKGAKVYKLTAYTTTDNINKRFRSIQRQSILRKVLVTLIIILLLASVIGKYIDLSDTSEFKTIVGEQLEEDN